MLRACAALAHRNTTRGAAARSRLASRGCGRSRLPPEGTVRSQAPGERSRLQSRAASGDERELEDLLRLHAPAPDVAIVRMTGTVDRRGAQLLAELAHQQLNRTPYLVIAPADVSELTRTRRIRPGNQRDRQSSAEDAPQGRTAGDGSARRVATAELSRGGF